MYIYIYIYIFIHPVIIYELICTHPYTHPKKKRPIFSASPAPPGASRGSFLSVQRPPGAVPGRLQRRPWPPGFPPRCRHEAMKPMVS